MITSDSRYADSQLVTITGADGIDRITIFPTDPVSYTFTYVNYQVQIMDRIDLLAYSFYGDSKQWWRIADANPETLDWSVINTGMIIRIPFLS